jgi:hypothetical protein
VSDSTAIDVGGAGERYEAAWNTTWSLDSVGRFLNEHWLHANPDGRRALLAEFAVRDLDLRLQQGEPASAGDYLRRYPDLRADPAFGWFRSAPLLACSDAGCYTRRGAG